MRTDPLQLHFECVGESCRDPQTTTVDVSGMAESGWPICAECAEDMEYLGWDVA